ncbi:MAG: SOS response-associated peptidase, partial [Methanomicrobiaceae archaeon]|nr:SOS response-associated peptidase [Methanomicrobiaceae archaeon]
CIYPFTMCGRYSLVVTDDLGARFRVHIPTLGLRSRFNVTPGSEMPVILRDGESRRMECAEWGLVPHWAKDPAIGRRLINARAETVAEKPAFRFAFRHHRCLVPASGFYEWKEEGGTRLPYYYHLAGDAYFSFAGIADIGVDAAGRPLLTYAFLTTDASSLVAPVHPRMPVILKEEDEAAWIDPETRSEHLASLLAPYRGEDLEVHRVSPVVNDPKAEGPGLIAPVKEWW